MWYNILGMQVNGVTSDTEDYCLILQIGLHISQLGGIAKKTPWQLCQPVVVGMPREKEVWGCVIYRFTKFKLGKSKDISIKVQIGRQRKNVSNATMAPEYANGIINANT